jgi:GH15 family glucan-1,4-alpha-glucosidase
LKQQPARRFVRVRSAAHPYPAISDYALIGDCHTAALISRAGSVDWCCLPRFDSDSCFGRMLDWKQGGHFIITPKGKAEVSREYLNETLVLATTYRVGRSIARVTDFFSMRTGGRKRPRRELVRIIEGIKGKMTFNVTVAPRMDYGDVKPWVFSGGRHAHFAVGSDTGTRIFGDVDFDIVDSHDLHAEVEVRPRRKLYIGLQFFRPEEANTVRERRKPSTVLQAHLTETIRWWRNWSDKIVYGDGPGVNIVRSAIRAHGGDCCRANHFAARAQGRGAQLGLPLLLDSGLHLHGLGPECSRCRI